MIKQPEHYNVDVVVDKGTINSKIQKKFDLGEKEVKNGKCDFVGVIYKNQSILISLPLKYIELYKFKQFTWKKKVLHIRTILNAILSYNRMQGLDTKNDFKSTFPFQAVIDIYEYYQKFGLYHEYLNIYKKGQRNPIDWKQTFKRSNSYLDYKNERLLYLSFYTKIQKDEETLVTKCMAFCLNYVNKYYHELLSFNLNEDIKKYRINEQLLKNASCIISGLEKILNKTYIDSNKNLIQNLIVFFKQMGEIYTYQFSLIQFNFHNVWEHAVNFYLNRYFKSFKNGKMLFSEEPICQYSFIKDTQPYDENNNCNKLQPDHYYIDSNNNIQYIFDSKYMLQLNYPNYKQMLYSFLYSNKTNSGKTINILLLPEIATNKELVIDTKINVQIKKELLPLNINDLVIYNVRLNEQKIISEYGQCLSDYN